MKEIIDIFSYSFMQRAMIVGVLIAVSSSLLGMFLVLKKQSMIGDGLAHVSFASVSIALLFNASPLMFSLPIVIAASFLIQWVSNKAVAHADSAIALISSFSVALGVLIASLSSGFNVDIYSYLFGSILLISKSDVMMTIILSILIIVFIIKNYRKLVTVTYDEDFARVMNINVDRYKNIMGVLTSIVIVIGIRVVGTMLISSMIVFPTLSALQLKKSFKKSLMSSVAISIVGVLIGIIASYIYNFPTGSSIVFVNGILFIVFYFVGRLK